MRLREPVKRFEVVGVCKKKNSESCVQEWQLKRAFAAIIDCRMFVSHIFFGRRDLNGKLAKCLVGSGGLSGLALLGSGCQN